MINHVLHRQNRIRHRLRATVTFPAPERGQVASPAAQLEPDVIKLQLVTVRKYDVDASSPWWRRWYFRGVYLPFVRWSFNKIGIPAQGSIDADGRFSWCEYICIATDEETAKQACRGEFYEHHSLPVNSALPPESIQYSEQVYPEGKDPHRYSKRAFPQVRSLADIAAERRVLTDLAEISKRILHKSQHSTSI